jgi:hypothetical protein
MSIVGSPGSEDRKKFYAACGFAAIIIVYVYFQFFRDPSTSAPAPATPVAIAAPPGPSTAASAGAVSPGNAAAGPAAKVVGTTSAALDPTLRMAAMLVTESVAYDGTGRNIFSASSAPPVVIQKPIAPARPQPIAQFVPRPPPPPPPTCPPQCPPIDLRFSGYFETPASGEKRAILVHGEDQFLAYSGEIVLRRYRVVSISANSIVIEDIPNNNKQTLPRVAD